MPRGRKPKDRGFEYDDRFESSSDGLDREVIPEQTGMGDIKTRLSDLLRLQTNKKGGSNQKYNHAAVVRMYAEGIADGRWTGQTDAAPKMGMSHATLVYILRKEAGEKVADQAREAGRLLHNLPEEILKAIQEGRVNLQDYRGELALKIEVAMGAMALDERIPIDTRSRLAMQVSDFLAKKLPKDQQENPDRVLTREEVLEAKGIISRLEEMWAERELFPKVLAAIPEDETGSADGLKVVDVEAAH